MSSNVIRLGGLASHFETVIIDLILHMKVKYLQILDRRLTPSSNVKITYFFLAVLTLLDYGADYDRSTQRTQLLISLSCQRCEPTS